MAATETERREGGLRKGEENSKKEEVDGTYEDTGEREERGKEPGGDDGEGTATSIFVEEGFPNLFFSLLSSCSNHRSSCTEPSPVMPSTTPIYNIYIYIKYI
jgi:hypothetical protein